MNILKRTALVFFTIMFLFVGCGYAFSDVADGAWYAENVNKMAELGLLTGYEDGTFRPDDTISNAEFVSIVNRCVTGLNLPSYDGGHWASENMKHAYNNHWYDYDEILAADFDKPITRQLAVKIIDLAFGIPENEHEDNAYYKYMTSIRDFNDIPGRYAYLVVRAYNNNILTGDENGCFNPASNITRAEACAIITRAKGDSALPEVVPAETAAPAQNFISGGVSRNGRLSVSGTQLINQNGEPIVLRGMSSHGIQWYANFTSYQAIKNTADRGANVFRIAMYTDENGYISNPESVKRSTFEAADNAIANDMYVIIDWHVLNDHDPLKYADEAAAFFAEASARYADAPNVIYEICNEPNGDVSWANNVKPYAERIIPVIRANTNAVILVGSPTWSQDVDVAADDPLAFGNIMYTCHFYAGTHGSFLRDKIDYALSKGAPIFISEWGTSAADGSGGVFVNETQDWMSFLNSRGLSHVNWSLCDKAETSAALNPGTDPNAVWTDDNLSDSGKIVFSGF